MNKLLVTLAIGLSASSAFCEEYPEEPKPAPFHMYLFGGLGYTKLDSPTSTYGLDRTEEENFSFRAGGGMLFPINDQWEWGFEMAGSDSGTLTYEGTYDSQAYDITEHLYYADFLLQVKYAFHQKWYSAAKAGLSYEDAEAFYDAGDASLGAGDNNKWLPEVDLALGYDLTDQFSTEVEYDHVFATDSDDKNSLTSYSSDALYINLVFNF